MDLAFENRAKNALMVLAERYAEYYPSMTSMTEVEIFTSIRQDVLTKIRFLGTSLEKLYEVKTDDSGNPLNPTEAIKYIGERTERLRHLNRLLEMAQDRIDNPIG